MQSIGVPQATGDAPPMLQRVAYAVFYQDPATGQTLPWNRSIPFVQSTIAAPEVPASSTAGMKVSPFADAFQRLREMDGLGLNWDSYGSEPPSARALEAARSLIWTIYQRSAYTGNQIVPYTVLPLSGGGVQIEWRGVSDAIEVEIRAEGVLGYLLVRGMGSTRYFDERDDVGEFRIVELALSII